MTLSYTKALLLWVIIFPSLFVLNVLKAVFDFIIWVFDLPTNVWEICLSLSDIEKQTDGVRKDGDKI